MPIFGRENTRVNGVFTSDRAKLVFSGAPGAAGGAAAVGGGGVTGVLVQSLNFNFTQNITRLHEIGVEGAGNDALTNIYLIGGRTQGQAGLNRVIGPKATIKELYARYGNVCNAPNNNMELQLTETDCSVRGSSQSLIYVLKAVTMQGVAVNVAAQDMVINEQGTLMFQGLDVN